MLLRRIASLISPCLLLTGLAATPAWAGGADALPPREPRVAVRVSPAGPGGDVHVLACDAQGREHSLALESRDGKLVAKAEPDATKPWLGVLLSDADEIERGGSGLPTRTSRWTVTGVADDSPAARAGLRRGDIVTGVEGRDVTTDGPGLLEGRKPGDRIRLDVERDGKAMQVPVTLAGHPGTVEFEGVEGMGALGVAGGLLGSLRGLEALKSLEGLRVLRCPPGTSPADCRLSVLELPSFGGPRLGVSVEPMSEQLARFFGAPEGRGLLVKDVVAGSAAEQAGVQAGDVILEVDGHDIRMAGDIREALSDRESGDSVRVRVLRRGDALDLSLTLQEPDEQSRLVLPGLSPDDAGRIAEEALAQARKALDEVKVQQVAEKQALAEARKALADAQTQREVEAEVAKARQALDEARRAREEARRETEREERRQRERSSAAPSAAPKAGSSSDAAPREIGIRTGRPPGVIDL